ncbi:Nramp family divalent metal transporter [Patulibacter sp.]|uniref:Nramp family divalent metal transporter n=1 Tax=Patulibacter sp. TaxID=1912859 RepID=UPI00271725D2|nr:Nramp family divalent metal transporter [Patulibacter sp.]MDO9408930.1 Nramp family divalent metal transporter [Patulibacter sp.]
MGRTAEVLARDTITRIEPTLQRDPPSATPDPDAPLTPSHLQTARSRGRIRGRLALLGPSFVAAVAYVDPGNFATNISAGAQFGYLLVWVVVMSSAMAMLVQYLSAKTGLATGHNLPELARGRFGRRTRFGLWAQAEVVAIATDMAEFVGAAIGLNLLFGVPLFEAGLITAVVAFAILALEQRGYRRFELAIAAMLGLVAAGFVYDLVAVGNQSASGILDGLTPGLAGSDSLLLVVGIIGATVMPHVVYLHSALTQNRMAPRDEAERRDLLRWLRIDVGLGLSIAGLINLSMMLVAAALFFRIGATDVDSIEAAHRGLREYVGGGAALAFAVALLASGLSSSSVGTYAGQIVMQGFMDWRIPLFVRRLVTMSPALVVLAVGLPTTDVLVVSQVVLSFGIPFALVPLIIISSDRRVMGSLVNRRVTTLAASVIATIIIGLNGYLIFDTVLG